MKYRLPLALLLLATSVFLSSCASTGSDREPQSSIPWNRPQQWEGSGGLGGFGTQ